MSLPDLYASIWALSALRVAIDTDLLATMSRGETDAPTLAAAIHVDRAVTLRIVELLEAYGFVSGTSGNEKPRTFVLTAEGQDLVSRMDWVRPDVAVTLGYANAFVVESRRSDLGAGWLHANDDVIRSQSMLSEVLNTRTLPIMVAAVPGLDRLGRDGAKLLDVGSGAAGLSVTFCKYFPSLHVVAIEPLRAARLEARTKIAANGLSNRIEVRDGRIEELSEESAYDVVFIAAPFMSDAALTAGLVRVKKALVPGGIVLTSTYRTPDDPHRAAAMRLRLELWGGGARSQAELAGLVEGAGLEATSMQVPGAVAPVIGRLKAG